MSEDYLSRFHTVEMLTRSATAAARGIDNTPPDDLRANLERLARGLDDIRELLGHPLEVSSGYRSPELNQAVGGVPRSQHTTGLACDFTCDAFGPPLRIAQAIGASSIAFDQCILEFGRWVHVSFDPAPRRRLLTIYESRVGYLDGLVDRDGNRIA